ncbi:MAG: hypothetical protein BDTLLHRC_001187 [Candidatus Fervidibacter sp.]|jgi:small subunit ribosomal protein S13
MARIAGVEIPDNKRLFVGLTYIYGVGRTLAVKACQAVGIDPMRKLSELSDEELARLRDYIERNYKVEGDLRREVAENIKRLIDIRCYRGLRHMAGLPVRGQRTRSNARTRKGPRKTVGTKKGKRSKKKG